MKAITPDEIFDLLGSVSCERDLREIQDYLLQTSHFYTDLDIKIFIQSIAMISDVFKK